LADLEYRVNESGGRLEFGELPAVHADPTQLRCLFQNLIANALKFRQATLPPRVKISGRIVADGFCEITVEDNGIGIEEAYLEQIFKPFTRLNPYSAYEGSGIGLAVCRKIVLRHGGKITAHSELGRGTRFVFSLPAETSALEAIPK